MRIRQIAVLPTLALALLGAATAGASGAPQAVHVMITNDDGVDSPGLEAMAAVLAADSRYRVTVVAPATQQSAQGHALTIHGEVRVVPHAPLAGAPTWAVEATPASVALLGLTALLAEDPPQLVVSGINRGENIGRAAWYSGTIGAAREAVLKGVPAVAVSLQVDWDSPQPDFGAAARWAKPVVDMVRDQGLPAGVLLNVNVPKAPESARGYRLARMDLTPDEVSRYDVVREEHGARWFRSAWRPPRAEDATGDTRLVNDGWVAIVPLGLDQTSYPELAELTDVVTLAPPPAAPAP